MLKRSLSYGPHLLCRQKSQESRALPSDFFGRTYNRSTVIVFFQDRRLNGARMWPSATNPLLGFVCGKRLNDSSPIPNRQIFYSAVIGTAEGFPLLDLLSTILADHSAKLIIEMDDRDWKIASVRLYGRRGEGQTKIVGDSNSSGSLQLLVLHIEIS